MPNLRRPGPPRRSPEGEEEHRHRRKQRRERRERKWYHFKLRQRTGGRTPLGIAGQREQHQKVRAVLWCHRARMHRPLLRPPWNWKEPRRLET